MMTSANATFQISGWDEDVYAELGPGAKLSKAEVAQTFSGDIEGEGAVTWLMAYTSEKSRRVRRHPAGHRHASAVREGSFLLTTQRRLRRHGRRGHLDGGRRVGHRRASPG